MPVLPNGEIWAIVGAVGVRVLHYWKVRRFRGVVSVYIVRGWHCLHYNRCPVTRCVSGMHCG